MCSKFWCSYVFAVSDALDLTSTLCGNRLLEFLGLNQWNSENIDISLRYDTIYRKYGIGKIMYRNIDIE
ncbi:hypothetical protein RvY_04491 [Ramazzottius varieornatus]|uniref:Uncharacterized protein n=1 Tax=Ramazzottius varieornatus TaxID=947166 RepID=A0A1D1V1S2_RAMVA|nr:hypothetical protein RvY_04491 [Ramazzottius varieornatus]